MLTVIVYQLNSGLQARPETYFFDVANHGAINIGRGQNNHILLKGKKISNQHARILVEDGKLIIMDLDSRNGLYSVNLSRRRRITRLRIGNADIFGIGNYALHVFSDNIDETSSDSHSASQNANNSRIPLLSASTLTRRMLRQVINDILRTEADVDAFCIDYFPVVAKRFSGSMDRQARLNLLFTLEEHVAVYNAMFDAYAKEMTNFIEQVNQER